MSAIAQPYCVVRVRVVLHEQLWSQFVMRARNKWFSIRQDGIKEGVVYLNDVRKGWGLPILQKAPLACRFFLPVHCGFLFFLFFFNVFFFYYFLFATSENHLLTKLVGMSASYGLDKFFCTFWSESALDIKLIHENGSQKSCNLLSIKNYALFPVTCMIIDAKPVNSVRCSSVGEEQFYLTPNTSTILLAAPMTFPLWRCS